MTEDEKGSIWDSELFEEEISATLISLYETKIVGAKKVHPHMRVTDGLLGIMRKQGIYIPERQRLIYGSHVDTMYALPEKASLSINPPRKELTSLEKLTTLDGYRMNFYIERIQKLPPKGFSRLGGGVLYRIASVMALDKGGVEGTVSYVSVDKEGNVFACPLTWNGNSQVEVEPHVLEDQTMMAMCTLNYEQDKYNVWTIDAQEKDARCVVGVEPEQVKSLLYARSLPTTVTGRKRPILHLVAAHRRRLKEGIEIDITDFLRGVQKVEMNGTVFTVKPSEKLLKDSRVSTKVLEKAAA